MFGCHGNELPIKEILYQSVFGDKYYMIGHKFTISVTMDVSPFAWCLAIAVLKKWALGCCHAGPMLLGWGEWKWTQYRGNYVQFLKVLFCFFFNIFFSNFKPPSPHMGSAVFLNIGLTQTCIAIAVPPSPTWEPYQSTKRNKVFECKTLLIIEVMEYGKMGFVIGLKCLLRDKEFNMRGGVQSPLSYSSHVAACTVCSSLWLSVPPPPPPPPPPPSQTTPLGPALFVHLFCSI